MEHVRLVTRRRRDAPQRDHSRLVQDSPVAVLARRGLPRAPNNVEGHTMDHRVVGNRPRMCGTTAQRFAIAFAGTSEVEWRHRAEGKEFDRVDLDVVVPDGIASTDPHLGPFPKSDGHGDIAREHARPQLRTELHGSRLGAAVTGVGLVECHPSAARPL
jgi:hypothetical protein